MPQSVALSMASVRFEWTVQTLILPALRGEGTNKRLGHPSVLALSTLRMLLVEKPERMAGNEDWSLMVRTECLRTVAGMVFGAVRSKHLVEGAPIGSFWLLLSQILKGSLRCLRLLWPASDKAGSTPPLPLDELLKDLFDPTRRF